MKKQYPFMAKLVKEQRKKLGEESGVVPPQSEIATKLGYKNGQYISNTERELTTFPDEKIADVAKVLGVSVDTIIQTKLNDERHNLERLVKGE